MNNVKIHIGVCPDTHFKVIGTSGADITNELLVNKVTIVAKSGEITRVVMELVAEVCVETEDLTVVAES